MKQLSLLTTLIFIFLSCKTNTVPPPATKIRLILTDTSNNRRAQSDLSSLEYRSKLEAQMGLCDLRKGADSLEIRLWYSFSFSKSKELFTLRLRDSICYFTFYEVYPRWRVLNNEGGARRRNYFENPVVDSVFSKTVVLDKGIIEKLHLDSLWLLKTESELGLSDEINFADCDSYIIEVADREQFRYLGYHCPDGLYEKTKREEVAEFLKYCKRIIQLAGWHYEMTLKTY